MSAIPKFYASLFLYFKSMYFFLLKIPRGIVSFIESMLISSYLFVYHFLSSEFFLIFQNLVFYIFAIPSYISSYMFYICDHLLFFELYSLVFPSLRICWWQVLSGFVCLCMSYLRILFFSFSSSTTTLEVIHFISSSL